MFLIITIYQFVIIILIKTLVTRSKKYRKDEMKKDNVEGKETILFTEEISSQTQHNVIYKRLIKQVYRGGKKFKSFP